MINFNKKLAKEILSELSKSTYSTLLDLQRHFIPQITDLGLEVISSGEYKLLESTYKTKELLFRINKPFNFKRDNFNTEYNGPMSTLINERKINPFILFIDNEAIDIDNITVVSDDRYSYIIVDRFYEYNFEMGTGTVYMTINGIESFNIPKVPEEFEDGLIMEIETNNPIALTSVYVNSVPINMIEDSGVLKGSIPYDNVVQTFEDDSSSNKVQIICNDMNIRKLKIYAAEDKRRSIVDNVRTISMNMDVEYSSTVYNSDTIFILFNGMVYTGEEYDMLPLPVDAKFINKVHEDIWYEEGDAEVMDNPFPEYEEYRFWKENFLVFKDNYLLNPNDVVTIFTDMGDLQSWIDRDYKFKLFFNTNTHPSIDNAYKVTPDRVDKFISRKKYSDMLFQIFDFKPEHGLSEEENMTKMFEEIMNYNSALMNDYFAHGAKKKTFTFTGTDIMDRATLVDNVYEFSVSKHYGGHYNNSALVYYNGLLYHDSHVVDNVNEYKILIDFDTLSIDDVLEIEFYFGTFNKSILFRIEENEPRPNHRYFPDEDMVMFSKSSVYQAFNLPESDSRLYPVDYAIKHVDSDNIRYEIEEDLYGKDLHMTSRRQFRKMQFVPIDEDTKAHRIILNNEFRFCNSHRNFLVFINGRRLDTRHIVYVPHGVDLPITGHYLILEYKLSLTDIVDVVYVPEAINESYIAHLPDHNIIRLHNRDILGYPMNDETVSIFINGKKMSTAKELVYTSDVGFAINTDIETVNNITIVRNIDNNDDMFALYRASTDIWTEYNIWLPIDSIKKLHALDSDLLIADIEPSMTGDLWTRDMVLYEVLRKHWFEHLEVLDPKKYYNYSLREHELADIQTAPQLCDDFINISATDNNSFESGMNLRYCKDFPGITHYVENTSGDVVSVEYRRLRDCVEDEPLSASVLVWVDAENEFDDRGMYIELYNSSGHTQYMGSLQDKDGNSLFQHLPQKQWVRLSLEGISVPAGYNFARLSYKIRSNGTKVHATYGRFERSSISVSATQVVRVDPLIPSIEEYPSQDYL